MDNNVQNNSVANSARLKSVSVEVRKQSIGNSKPQCYVLKRLGLVAAQQKQLLNSDTKPTEKYERNNFTQNIVRVKNTPAYIGVSKSTYHNYRNYNSKSFDPSFPALFVISRNCKGHLKHELNAWLEQKKVLVNEPGGNEL
jgi:predicted DNA-binding transcriptional regulator AlpA